MSRRQSDSDSSNSSSSASSSSSRSSSASSSSGSDSATETTATTSRTATTTATSTTRTGTTSGTTTTSTTATGSANKRVAFRQDAPTSNATATSQSQATSDSSDSDDDGSSSNSSSSSSGSSDSNSGSTSRTTTSATTTQSASSQSGRPNLRTQTASGTTNTSDDDDDDSSSSSSGSSDSSDSDSSSNSDSSTRTGTTARSGTTTTSSNTNQGSTRSGTTQSSSTTSATATTTRSGTNTNATRRSSGTSSSSHTTSRTGTTTQTGTTTTNTPRVKKPKNGGGRSSSSSSGSSSTSSTSSTGTSSTATTSRTATTNSTSTSRTSRSSRTTDDTTSTLGTNVQTPRTRDTPGGRSDSLSKTLDGHISRSRTPKADNLRPLPAITIPNPPARKNSSSAMPTAATGGTAEGLGGSTSSSERRDDNTVAKLQLDANVAGAMVVADEAIRTATTAATLEGDSKSNGKFDPRQSSDSAALRNGAEGTTANRYGNADADALNKSGSTICTAYDGDGAAGSPEQSPSRVAVTAMTTRVVRQQVGVACERMVPRRGDRLNAAYMIRYRSVLDHVYAVLRRLLILQLDEQLSLPAEERSPDGSFSIANVKVALRAFGVDEGTVLSTSRSITGAHLPLDDLQAIVEKYTITRVPDLFRQRFAALDPFNSGEISLKECNRLLVNSKIGAAVIGTNSKVTVKLALFRWSLGVSIQQYADQPEFFDLAPSANFRLSYQANNDVLVNGVFSVTNLVQEERECFLQALHACAHIRASVDAATMEDQQVCYEPLIASLLAHPKGWMPATAVQSGVKSLFRERLVQSLIAPMQALEESRKAPHQDPFLLSTIKTSGQRQSNFMPKLRVDDCVFDRAAADTTKVFATLKFSEIRLPKENISHRCPFYVLVSLVTEAREIMSATRIYATRQKKPSDIWTFPKDADTITLFGSPSDIVYIEICYSTSESEAISRKSAKGVGPSSESSETEHSCGFSSCRLDGVTDGVKALIVSGGTIYDRTIKQGAEEMVKGFFPCTSQLLAMRILVEGTVGKPKTCPDLTSLPSRFVIDSRFVDLLALCREAIFDRLDRRKVGGTSHVLNLTRDHVVRQALSVTEDNETLSALSVAWNGIYRKFQRDQKADRNFVFHQLLTLMCKVAAASNCVVNSEEILKIIRADSHIMLQNSTPLRPVEV